MSRAVLFLPLLLLAACSGGTAPSGEDRQLDEAAASLDANSADTNAAVIVDEDENGSADDNASSGDNEDEAE